MEAQAPTASTSVSAPAPLAVGFHHLQMVAFVNTIVAAGS
jgi:hypothetical protein